MGEIEVAGGGSWAVETESMAEFASRLRRAAERLRDGAGLIGAVTSALAGPGGPDNSGGAGGSSAIGADVVAAGTHLTRAADAADELASAVHRAAERYGHAEAAAQHFLERSSGLIAWMAGAAAPTAGLVLLAGGLPTLLGVLGSAVGGYAIARSRGVRADPIAARGVLSDPRTVTFLRLTVSSVDNALAGLTRAMPPWASDGGGHSSPVLGVSGAARVVIGALSPGLLAETPVSVVRTADGHAAAPRGFQDLAARIPATGEPAQLRIERYRTGTSGRPTWIVYSSGTHDLALQSGSDPWDTTSNLNAVAQRQAGSVRATLDALEAAGAKPGDAVVGVGYSQGGIVATNVIREGRYRNAGLVTFGSPVGQLSVPGDAPRVSVEIDEDLVPALGGEPLTPGEGGLDRVIVRRSIYDGGGPPPGADAVPAHALPGYRQTAGMMDASHDPRLRAARSELFDLVGEGEMSRWRGERLGTATGGATGTATGTVTGTLEPERPVVRPDRLSGGSGDAR